MANSMHVAKLKEGVLAWNKWREENPDVKPDLSEAELQQIDLRSIETDEGYIGVNVKGANLYRANLKGANLYRARLEGVILPRPYLTVTNLFEADLAGAYLRETHLENAYLQDAHLEEADLCVAHLEGTTLRNSHLEGTFLWKAHLEGADLREALLEGADLREAHLERADLRGANLENANVTGVKFSRETLQGHYIKLKLENERGEFRPSLDINWGQRKFHGIRVSTCYGSQEFKSFAQDQDYLEEFRGKGGWRNFWFWIWYLTCDCGRSLKTWLFWFVLSIYIFMLGFWVLGDSGIQTKEPFDFSFPSLLYYSLATFFTFSLGEVSPKTLTSALVLVLMRIIGYFMLAGLISIFANKIARRA